MIQTLSTWQVPINLLAFRISYLKNLGRKLGRKSCRRKIKIQQYQRRKQVEQDKNTKWGSSTLPLPNKPSPQQSSSLKSSNSTTTPREVSKKFDSSKEVSSKEDFNLDIMDYLSKLQVPVPLSLLIQLPHIRSHRKGHDFPLFFQLIRNSENQKMGHRRSSQIYEVDLK